MKRFEIIAAAKAQGVIRYVLRPAGGRTLEVHRCRCCGYVEVVDIAAAGSTDYPHECQDGLRGEWDRVCSFQPTEEEWAEIGRGE